MAQPLRSLPPQIKNAPLVVPTRRVKFVRVEVIKASLLIRTTTVHYIIRLARSNVRSLWVKSGHCVTSNRCPLYPRKRTFIGTTHYPLPQTDKKPGIKKQGYEERRPRGTRK